MKNIIAVLVVLVAQFLLQTPAYGHSVRLKVPERKVTQELVYQQSRKAKFLKAIRTRSSSFYLCKRGRKVRLTPSLGQKYYWSKKVKG
ncbi:MAG: hypothetical protein GW949_02205 [Spirochaetales bacterium]|nr:hypothetical protein [Spirochaetales bacterium]